MTAPAPARNGKCPHRHPRLGFQCQSRPHSPSVPCSATETVDDVLCVYGWWPKSAVRSMG